MFDFISKSNVHFVGRVLPYYLYCLRPRRRVHV